MSSTIEQYVRRWPLVNICGHETLQEKRPAGEEKCIQSDTREKPANGGLAWPISDKHPRTPMRCGYVSVIRIWRRISVLPAIYS